MLDLKVQYVPISALKPYKGNARTHSKRQIRQIANSIERFGFVNPILVDDDDTIVAGHGRVDAAKLLGLGSVPVVRLSHLSEPERRAYVIADNRLAEKAGWDRELLALELKGLIDISFEIELTGFEIAEADIIIGEADERLEDAKPEDELPSSSEPVVSRSGDLWQLGDHRLVCGDARSTETFGRLMADERADMVFTDPPYNVPIGGHVSGLGKLKHREFAMASGEMSKDEFVAFLLAILGLARDASRDGSLHYVCMDWRHVYEMAAVGRMLDLALKNICVWDKGVGGMGSHYRSQHEFVFVFKHGDEPHVNTVELGRHGRNRTNVWSYPGANTARLAGATELNDHPTPKPVALVADAIKDCTKRRQIVLDPFGGSGTTLIAAHKTGRCARLIEIDPRYCDVIVLRWQSFAGRAAVLSGTGLTFEEVAEERALGEAMASGTAAVASETPLPSAAEGGYAVEAVG